MSAGEERRKQAFVLARIRRVQRRLNSELTVQALVGPAWGFAAASALFRFGVQRGVWLAVPLFAVAMVWATLWLTRRRRVTEAQAAVIADRQANAGGLLLTRLEMGVGEWELPLNSAVRQLAPPKVKVARPAGLVSLALMFWLVAMLIPLPPPPVNHVNAAAASRVEELAQKLDAVAREEPVDANVKEELERLREELKDGNFDSADWEAADSLGKELDRKAEEAGAELEKANQAASKLQDAMANAQSGEAVNREKEELEQALMQLSDGQAQNGDEAMKQALAQNGAGEQGQEGKQGEDGKQGQQGQNGQQQGQQGQNGQQQGQNGQQQAQNGQQQGQNGSGSGPSKSQLSDLKKALQQRRDQLAKAYNQGGGPQQSGSGQSQRGSASSSGKGEQASNGSNQGQGSSQGNGGEDGKGEGKESGQRFSDGEHASRQMGGGAEKGGGDDPSELVFAGKAEMDPDRLKVDALPKGKGGEGEELWGLIAANPKTSTGHSVAGGTGQTAAGDQSPANREGNYLPRNRHLIQKYFDSK